MSAGLVREKGIQLNITKAMLCAHIHILETRGFETRYSVRLYGHKAKHNKLYFISSPASPIDLVIAQDMNV